MTATILDGRATAKKIRAELASKINPEDPPRLEVILVGDDPASQTYVRNKERVADQIGIRGTTNKMSEDASQKELLAKIRSFNEDENVNGILVQLPLPDHIDEKKVIEAINPLKDVDCFHPYNLGRLMQNSPVFKPATPGGIMTLLNEYVIETEGKKAVVLGRSDIVGRPLSVLLSQKGVDATVTLVHSRTKGISEIVARSDLVFSAVGSPGFVKGEWIKEGAVVVDVGINSVEDPSKKRGYRLVGDVEFDLAKERASYITPVPGGVGPMTIATLMENVLRAKERQSEE